MAPIKFEENIREKLQERELNPSHDSWDKLAAQLEDNPKKNNPTFLWMAIAATVVGILLLVTLFTTAIEDKVSKELVEQETIETPKEIIPTGESSITRIKEDEVKSSNTIATTAATTANNNIEIVDVGKTISVSEKNILKPLDVVIAITTIETPIESKNLSNEQQYLKEVIEDNFVNNKVEEVVAQVKKRNSITPEEINSLLAKAQQDIATHRILNSPNRKVDASALLNDVESALEQSFRDKVFDALGDGFNKVRTAVAERNN